MKVWKTVLVLAAVLVAAVVVLGPDWLESWNAQRAQEAKQYRLQGETYGRTADTQQCMDTALNNLQGCVGNTCTINQGVFLKACLSVAVPNPVLCEGIPPFRNKMLEKEKEWARYFCADKAITHDGCRFLLRRQQAFCSGGIPADAVADQAESESH